MFETPEFGASMRGLIDLVLPFIKAAAMTIARPLGFLIVFPVFSWMGLQGMIRNVVALAFGAPFAPLIYDRLILLGAAADVEYLAMIAAKEFMLGVVLAAILGGAFWAAETAGTYVDVYRGSSSATVISPAADSEPLISGAIFTLTLVAIFLAAGGLRVALDALYTTYEIWPVFELAPNFTRPLGPIFVDVLAEVARLALVLSAPIMIALFLGELALALASRFAPQVNVFDATLSAKNLAYLAIMPAYLYLMVRFYGPDALDLEDLMQIIREAVR